MKKSQVQSPVILTITPSPLLPHTTTARTTTMSNRFAYNGDYDIIPDGLWSTNLYRAKTSKRGQKARREFANALLALPERKLCAGFLMTSEGLVCANGALALHRGTDLSRYVDYEMDGCETADFGKYELGLAYTLSWTVGGLNDDPWDYLTEEEKAIARTAGRTAYMDTYGQFDPEMKKWQPGSFCGQFDSINYVSNEARWRVVYEWVCKQIAWQLPATA